MKILFIGNLRQISNVFFSKLEEDYKCVIYSEQTSSVWKGKGIINYQKDDNDEDELQKVFSTFDFETVCFFSGALDGTKKVYDELEKLESVIYESKRHKVQNVIYITTNDLSVENRIQATEKSREILLNACEKLCKTFAAEHQMRFLVLKIPYLYNCENKGNQLMNWILSGNKGKEISISGSEYSETDFLCDEDLGELISRILDEPIQVDYQEMYLSGENGTTFGELAKVFEHEISEAKIVYKNYNDCIPCCKKDGKARTEYGWYPKHILEEDIKRMIEENLQKSKKRRKLRERRRRYQKLQDKIRVVVELLVLFLLAEILNYITKDNVLINFIDFRLVFVAIMGTMNGLNPGVASAIMASIGYVAFNTTQMQWQVVFYNVENWLPFACYFLLGAISGYTRDKHDDEVIYAKEEHDILENKYIFLNELYNKVLESKDSFNSQIIGYKDSFGKVYSVVKKLDSILPDKVFYEAVNTLEELLENYSVAIYTVNPLSDFARLNVCSKSINNSLNKSMKMSDYPEMMKCLRNKKGFVNTACVKDYPAYAAPIQKNGELMGMILLMNSTNHQMNMEFANKFNIISDLICDALIRAMEFEQFSDNYLEGTQILRKDKFKDILSVKERMQEKQYMDYVLLQIQKQEMDLKELSERICGMVRNNDVLGMGEGGEIYLLLSQTRRNDLSIIEERMKKNNILFEVVKG